MKVVLDTNVILSGLLFPGGPPDKIVRAVLTGRLQNATSPDLLTELRRVLERKFKRPSEKIDPLIRLISEASLLVYPTERVCIIKDHEADNRVVECALTAKADFLVTGDEAHLLRLKSVQGIPIIEPSEFILKIGIV